MKKRLIFTMALALLLVATLALPVIAATEQEVPASVTVSQFMSITITDAGTAGINFGSLSTGTSNNPDTDANDTTPSITVGVDTGSVNVDLKIKGTDFVSGGNSFGVANGKYSLTYAGAKVALSTTYATFATDVPATGAATLWHWLDVPVSGVAAGAYSSNFSYQAVAH